MQLLVRAEAAQDIASARRWYERQQSGLGGDFERQLEELTSLVLEMPDAFPVAHAELRRALTRRFPCAVYYRPLADDRLEITAVPHAPKPGPLG